jgi:hypothetical protein
MFKARTEQEVRQDAANIIHEWWCNHFVKGELFMSRQPRAVFGCADWPGSFSSKDSMVLEPNVPWLVVGDPALESVSKLCCHSYVDVLYQEGIYRLRDNTANYTLDTLQHDYKRLSL